MIKYYIKVAIRSLKKKRLYTSINILGLCAGITFIVLIGAFVWQELQVNKNLKNSESQYILTSQWKDPNMGVDFATLGPIAENLKEEYGHLVADYYRWDGITSIISTATKNFREGIQLGDENVLKMYGFNLLHGDVKTAFKDPFSVVIHPEKAIKFFGKTDVVGEVLTIQNFEGENHQFKITGVIEKLSENSITKLIKQSDNGFIIAKNSSEYFKRANFKDWTLPIFVSYIELQPGVTAQQLEKPLKQLLSNHASKTIQENLTVVPVKLTDYYLNKDNGSLKRMLYTLSLVGLFIIFMAMINFINIAVSHSGSRVKEIGVRKVLGGKRRQLIFQFLTESIILITVSTVLAFILYTFFRSWFEQLIGKELIGWSQFPMYFLILPFVFIAIIGLLLGVYPALVASSFKPIDAIQGKFKIGAKGALIRRSLLGFQYVTSLIVLIAALLVTKQLDGFFGKSLGYDKDYIVTAAVPRDWSSAGVEKMLTVRNELAKIPSIESVSLSYEIPNGNNGFQISVYKSGKNPEQAYATQGLVSDDTYLKTYDIPLLAGQFFEAGDSDPNSVVINKKALYAYGFKTVQEAIGQNLNNVGAENPLSIKGVISDFHFESMHQEIKPQLFFNVNTSFNYRYLSFKMKPGDINNTLTAIQKEWSILMPRLIF